MTTTPAGWYSDPTKRFDVRYWDGGRWTQHVSSGGVQATDEPSMSPSGSTESVPSSDVRAAGVFSRITEDRRGRAAVKDEVESTVIRAASGDPAAMAALPRLVEHVRSLYRSGTFEKKRWGLMALAVRSVIDDDVLTRQEQQHLDRIGQILGTPVAAIEQHDVRLYEELVIAAINDGRLPQVSVAGVLLKQGEVAHGSFPAQLLREHTVRQYRGGSSGFSIPLGKGIRYRVGAFRGHSVVVGTELTTQDSGVFCVTNQRSLFAGSLKTLEFRHDRLVGLEQYADGLRLNVSNRQTAALIRMRYPSVAGALVQVAASRLR